MDAYNANDLKIKPVLDNMFIPASAEHRNFIDMAEKSGKGVPLVIALERGDGLVSTWETRVFQGSSYDD